MPAGAAAAGPAGRSRGVAPQGSSGSRGLVIAVDGPAGSGKSSAARAVAAALRLRYLDTGAMYRAVTWWLLQHGVDVTVPGQVLRQFADAEIQIGTDPDRLEISVGGIDVAGPIRERDVSNAVSFVAALQPVREHLIGMQRQIIADAAALGPGIVAEGRDIGTVVAPSAPVKVYLTASAGVRAVRRSKQLTDDPAATVGTTRSEQALRDQRDAAQMAMAADAVPVDTTGLSLDEVVAVIVGLAEAASVVPHGR
jgi:CMP/dCMP kinase